MPVLDSAAPRSAWLRAAVAVYLTIRVSALGFTLVLPLVGAASAAAHPGLARMAGLMLVALSFHVFAYVLNDVVDLWLDRSEPLRADSPLVQGAVGPRRLMVLAWAQLPIAFGLVWALGAHRAALALLGLAFAAMAVYDVYGKRCRWPLLTDAVQSIGWCALLGVGAWWDGPVWPAHTGWITAYVFFCVMLVQGVHGGLRDLANDQRGGARTTALWLGARPFAATGIVVSRVMVAYAVMLQAALWVTALAALTALASPMWPTLPPLPTSPTTQEATASPSHAAELVEQPQWLSLCVIALLAAATVALVLAYQRRADRQRLIAAGAWNIVATLFVLPALAAQAQALAAVEAVVLLGALALPIASMLVYNGSHWRLAPEPRPEPTLTAGAPR